MRYVKSIFQPGMAVIAAVLAIALLTLELRGPRWLSDFLGSTERLRARYRSGPGLISRINARFIRTRPVLWQLRLPAAITLMLLVILSGWFAIDLSEKVIDLLEDQLLDRVDGDVAAIVIIVSMTIFLVGLVITLMQVQRRYFQLDLRRRNAGTQFFLALFFPVLFACLVGSVVTALEVGEDETGDGAVWYAAAVCAYLAATFSWSQTFLGLRTAILLAAGFMALSGLMFFLLIISDPDEDVLVFFGYALLAALFFVFLLGLFGQLNKITSSTAVVTVTYASSWSTISMLLMIDVYFRDMVPIQFRALTVNCYFIVMALCLLPLFNRLQEIATAPAND